MNDMNQSNIKTTKKEDEFSCEECFSIAELKKTISFMQEQLIKEEKMAMLGQLAAGVAHEINNPLGFVASNFNTLKKYFEVLKEILKEYSKIKEYVPVVKEEAFEACIENIKSLEEKHQLDFIQSDLEDLFADTQEGVSRISKIITGLRMFSHSANGDDFEEYDLNEGIKNTLTIAKNEIKYYAEVSECLETLPYIQAIGGHINQVILNLLINAVHAIKEKTAFGEIKIGTHSDDEFVYCTIEDNGTGIEKENVEKVFEPFFTTKPVGVGTGLGLSISYDIIVKKHSGNIAIESEKGVGAKFTIKLPIKHKIENS